MSKHFKPAMGDHAEGSLGRFPVMRVFSADPALMYERPLCGRGAVLLLHLRRSAAAAVEVLIRLGMDPAHILCVGKDYRYPDRAETIAELERIGVSLAAVDRLGEALAAFSVRLGERPFLIVEDGGHVAPLVYRDPALLNRCVGFVEQTSKGIWRVKEAVAEPTRPHLDLPASLLKRQFECGSVGQAVYDSISALLAGYADAPKLEVGVIGSAGVIGAAVAEAFHRAGAKVAVHDRAPPPYYALKCLGRYRLCATREELIEGRDLIVGCTGSPVLGVADIGRLKDGVILASSGSEQTEFPLAVFEQLSLSVDAFIPEGAAEARGLVYQLLPEGRRVIVLEDGRPVNLGAAGPTVEDSTFDLIMALLCAGAVELARGRYAGRTGFVDDFDAIAERFGFEPLFTLLHREA